MQSRTNMSPWEIGQRHWDQKDLYTTNARTDAAGYGLGPSVHPEEGSFAYVRDPVPEEKPPISEHLGAPVLTDASLAENARAVLELDSWLDTSDIEVTVKAAEITLRGTVTELQQKQRAEDDVSGCVGVVDVHNELEIRKDDDDGIAFTMPILVTAS